MPDAAQVAEVALTAALILLGTVGTATVLGVVARVLRTSGG